MTHSAAMVSQGRGAWSSRPRCPVARRRRATARRRSADPFEPFNRAMYAIHEPIDDNIVRPMAQAWVDYVPLAGPARGAATSSATSTTCFSALNGLLQGKLEKAGNDLGRVITINVLRALGLIDIASEAGIPKGDEDFGQTFGYWGIPQGPFLFVPILGPTTVRDGTGLAIRALVRPHHLHDRRRAAQRRCGSWAASTCACRRSTPPSMVDQAAIDQYTFIRRSYLQRREYLVHDGNPAEEGRRRMIRRFDAARRAVLLARARARRVGPALAQEAPDALVKRVSQEVMQIIKSDPKVQAGDQARIREVVETKLLPNFDFRPDDRARDGPQLDGRRRPSSRSASPTSSGRCSCAPTRARSRSTATRRSSTSRCARKRRRPT